MVRSGVTFPALIDLLRELYVNVAEYDFVLPGKEQTDSRVSLLTGIHRKEVRRLRGAGAPVNVVPTEVSRTSRILAHWLADQRFCGPDGQPLALARTSETGPSFEELVAAITRDLRPRAVLDEWLDRGIATLDAEDRVVLAETAYVPGGGDDRQLYYLGRNLHDHIAAAVANVEGKSPAFLERAVHYDGLTREIAEAMQERSRSLAMVALQTANREAHQACEALEARESVPEGTHRWIFGVYVYAEERQPAGPATGRAAPEDGAAS